MRLCLCHPAILQHLTGFTLCFRAMYVLLLMQFSSSTFYDPARRALEPKLVPKKQLHLATTLDTFAWSVTVAVGSSLGGAVVSRLGTTMCFVLDSCTFVCAAICVLILQVGAALINVQPHWGFSPSQCCDVPAEYFGKHVGCALPYICHTPHDFQKPQLGHHNTHWRIKVE